VPDATSRRLDARRVSRAWVLPAALSLVSVLCQVPGIFRAADVYNEGLVLVGAQRILQGEVPYRDFWNTHSPGQITVVAGLLRVFGASIMVERVYDVLVRAGIAVVIFLLARRTSTRGWALAAWAAATVLAAQFQYFSYVTFPALLCALAGFLALLNALNGQTSSAAARRVWLLLAGAGAGCSILFRHDLGLEATLAGVVVIWADVVGRRGPVGTAQQRTRARIGETLSYVCGAGAVLLPVVVIFYSLGTPWARVKEIFFTYPILIYPHFRGLPIPATLVGRLTAAAPAAVILAGLIRGLWATWRPGETSDRVSVLLPLALTGTLAFPQAYTRFDPVQQIPVVLLSAAILPGLLAPLLSIGGGHRALYPICGPAALLLIALMFHGPLTRSARGLWALVGSGPAGTTQGLERARWIRLGESQAEAVKAVQAMTAAGDAIYVGLERHDKTTGNDALFYFLSGRRCATYYHNMLPGLVTTEPVQREILADLERNRAKVVVLTARRDKPDEPNQSRLSSGVDLLDEGIRRDFARTRAIGHYEIRERKPAPSRGSTVEGEPAT
jgi:hypothetical protein